jgi:hypothetical protein
VAESVDAPFGDEIRENRAEAVDKVRRAEILLIHWVEFGPGWREGEEIVLARASLLPGDALLQVLRTRLFYAVPVVFECFFLVADERQPAFFVSARNSVGKE